MYFSSFRFQVGSGIFFQLNRIWIRIRIRGKKLRIIIPGLPVSQEFGEKKRGESEKGGGGGGKSDKRSERLANYFSEFPPNKP